LAGDRRDHQRLERLKLERQEKINELKEKTNYYITQQLIQVRTQDHGLFSAVLMVKISLQSLQRFLCNSNWFEFS
jgi:hypothetical protein